MHNPLAEGLGLVKCIESQLNKAQLQIDPWADGAYSLPAVLKQARIVRRSQATKRRVIEIFAWPTPGNVTHAATPRCAASTRESRRIWEMPLGATTRSARSWS